MNTLCPYYAPNPINPKTRMHRMGPPHLGPPAAFKAMHHIVGCGPLQPAVGGMPRLAWAEGGVHRWDAPLVEICRMRRAEGTEQRMPRVVGPAAHEVKAPKEGDNATPLYVRPQQPRAQHWLVPNFGPRKTFLKHLVPSSSECLIIAAILSWTSVWTF